MIIDRSPADEMTLISALISLTSPDPELVDRVEPGDFGDGTNIALWEAARAVRHGGGRVTARAIIAQNSSDAIKRRLTSAMGHVTTVSDVITAESTVRELARNRRLHSALLASLERIEGAATYAEALDLTQRELGRLSEPEEGRDGVSFGDAVASWWERQNDTSQRSRPITLPWDGLNERLAGGLHRGRTYVLGARPGNGKSLMGSNMMQFAAEMGNRCAIFSLEMGQHEVMSRLLAAGARAEYGQITRRRLDEYNRAMVVNYENEHAGLPLTIFDKSRVTLAYLETCCRSLQRSGGLDAIFVDYLQLMTESDSKLSRERQIALLSRGLKILAGELDIAVVIASQLNRSSVGDARPPALNDLRESGSIEQDCDVAILLHRKRDEVTGDPGAELDLTIAKNRTGPLATVTELWRAHHARIG